MRILVVQESDWLERGPHQSHHLMERLSQRGHEVRVIDFEISWRANEQRRLIHHRQVYPKIRKATPDGFVTVIRPLIVKLPILEYLSLAISHRREIERQMREYSPDVIVGFGILNSTIAISLAGKLKIPFVYYLIDELHRLVPQRAFQGFARLLEEYNVVNSDLVISINEGLRDYSISMGARPERTMVIRAGVDLSRFKQDPKGKEIRARYNIGDHEIVLFFMGWLYSFSGLKEVASAIVSTQEVSQIIRLLIVGRGELRDELERIRQTSSAPDRMLLVDWQPYDEIPKFLASSDICILPAQKNEIMMNIVPIKIYEYMAAGKPVIVTSLPGLLREFGVGNGVIYVDSPEDVLGRANEMIRAGAVESEGMKSRVFVANMDWETITDDFENILTAMVRNGICQRKD